MTQPWKERKARMPGDSRRTPGAGETLETIWRGAARLTGREKEAMAALNQALDRLEDFDRRSVLEDLAGQAQKLVLDCPGFGLHESWQKLDHVGPDEETGYGLLYAILIEPFRFLEQYERKDF